MATKLTPPPHPSDVVHTNDRHVVRREREFPPSRIHEVFLKVQEERISGTLLLDLRDGGIRNIRLQEETSMNIGEKSS